LTSDLIALLEERAAPLRAPIEPERPGGEDLSHGPEFERIERELAKLTSVDGIAPEWEVVADLSTRLLATKTKDFRLAIWGMVAKTRVAQWQGLAEGLVMCRELVRDYWTTMYPDAKRLRGRANVYQWACDQVVTALEPSEVALSDEEGIRVSERLFDELDRELESKLGDAHPGRGRIPTLFENKIAAIPAPLTTPSEPRPLPVEAAQPTVIMGLVAPQSVGEAPKSVAESLDILLTAAQLLFDADPSDASPYRIRRACIDLRTPGGSSEPPSQDERARLLSLAEASDWATLLAASENAILTTPLWLDAHRHAARALAQLGASYEAACDVVETSVRAIVARDPTRVDSAFSDGTPCADDATRRWLEVQVRRGTSAAALLIAEDEELSRSLETARQMVRDKRVADGITLALGVAHRAGNARARFLARLAVGRLALDAGEPALARPILEQLVDEVTSRGLEEWEPDLCVGLYHTVLTNYDDAAGADTKKDQLFDRVCKLNPSVALLIQRGRMTGKTGK
jgi:type VI secretion system protein VasJ